MGDEELEEPAVRSTDSTFLFCPLNCGVPWGAGVCSRATRGDGAEHRHYQAGGWQNT